MRDNGIIRKLAAYVILGINTDGKKDVLTIQVGNDESSKYWLSVLNELKNRGIKDILILCTDGLIMIKEDCSCLSKNRVSALYRTSGTEYVEICSG